VLHCTLCGRQRRYRCSEARNPLDVDKAVHSRAHSNLCMLRSAMPSPNCPSCGHATARHLSAATKAAPVQFFACPQCAHVWRVEFPGSSGHVAFAAEGDADVQKIER